MPGKTDWYPEASSGTARSITVLEGKSNIESKQLDSCFKKELERIKSLDILYKERGPNSNTVVKTLLHNCGLPEKLPVDSLSDPLGIPGWHIFGSIYKYSRSGWYVTVNLIFYCEKTHGVGTIGKAKGKSK